MIHPNMDLPFLEALGQGGLVGDGAMGSLLYERGVFVNRNFDEVNLSQPELIYRIHREYMEAGAHVLETNTYGANRVRLERHGLAAKTIEINRAGVHVARQVADGAAYVAGSMGPSGLTLHDILTRKNELFDAYAEQATILVSEGCDALFIETFHLPDELEIAVRACRSTTPIPVIAHIAPDLDGTIHGGMAPRDLAHAAAAWGASAIGANCAGPALLFELVKEMLDGPLPVTAIPNAGTPNNIEDRLIYLATPENFGVFARRFFQAGIKLVGGCCGTNPAHIARVSAASRMLTQHTRPVISFPSRAQFKQPLPVNQRSNFGAKLGKQFVISVEVNPSQGLSLAKPLQAAQMLTDAGADVINIADGPRATVRMSNLALAVHFERELGIEVILHVCCRDHNLLGLQAGVLGAHSLGIRNLVVITGDPPKIGDYPDATAVYDVDSIGLLRILHGYNCGVDPAGKSMDQTKFVLATGAEPAAHDYEREILRLRQKVEAGANLIMTQPVYSGAQLDRFLRDTEDLNTPILVGILPLASYKNAEFIHNHIPGMTIPEDIHERMRKAGKGEAGQREGVAIAIEALMSVKDRVAGTYIMPPLGRYDMAVEIIEAVRGQVL